MDARTKKILLIAGAAVLAVFVMILSALLIRSCSADSKFEKYYAQAEKYYDGKEYSRALTAIEKALEVSEKPGAYLLKAEIHYAMDDLDKAIETLYIGSYKFSDEAIAERLEEFKALKLEQENGNGIVTIGDMEIPVDETALDLSEMRLTNISGLEKLTELQSLTLTDNGIEDLSPLSGLVNLTYLHLGNNKVSSLNALTGLTVLKTLYLDGNPIKDFSPLYSLKALTALSIRDIEITREQLDTLKEKLPGCAIYSDDPEDEVVEITLGGVTFMSDVTELDLGNLGITDISALSKCTKLKKLDIRSNAITDLTPLSDLEALTWLCIWNNRISDLSPLSALKSLTYLDADSNRITSVTALANITALEELWLSYNDLSGFSTLKSLTSLRRLGLKNTGIKDADLDSIKGLTNLRELSLDENTGLSGEAVDKLKEELPNCYISHSELVYTVQFGGKTYQSDETEISAGSAGITDISVLEKFTKLETLILNGNKISDISVVSKMTELVVLELGNDSAGNANAVSNLTPLVGLTKLKTLNLIRNKVTDITPLASLTGLEELHLSYNSLTSISTLSGLTNLKTLSLDYCALKDISALSSLTSLVYLGLEGNSISDVTALKGLTSLKELYIGNNSLTYGQVQELKAALPGCQIYAESQLPATADVTAASIRRN